MLGTAGPQRDMLDDFNDYDHRLNAAGTPPSTRTVPPTQKWRTVPLYPPWCWLHARPTNLINYASVRARDAALIPVMRVALAYSNGRSRVAAAVRDARTD